MLKKIAIVFGTIILILNFSQLNFAQKNERQSQKRQVKKSSEPTFNVAELSFAISDNPLKVSPETTQLPKEFRGHDFTKLFATLEKEIGKMPNDATPEQKYQLLKGKKLLGNLTVDDYFVFRVQDNSSVHGYSKDLSKNFNAVTFQLREEKRIEADSDVVGDVCFKIGVGTAPPNGETPEDFVKFYKDNSIWQRSYLLLNTVKPIYNRKSYKGKPNYTVGSPKSCRTRTVVPSPQAQYELAFTNPQPFEVAESETSIFSFKDYEYKSVNGVGVIAWIEKGEKLIADEGDYAKVLFLVKLTPPFVKSEILKDRDLIENKPFTMFSKTFFVNIESLWVVGGKSGKVFKKIDKQQ